MTDNPEKETIYFSDATVQVTKRQRIDDNEDEIIVSVRIPKHAVSELPKIVSCSGLALPHPPNDNNNNNNNNNNNKKNVVNVFDLVTEELEKKKSKKKHKWVMIVTDSGSFSMIDLLNPRGTGFELVLKEVNNFSCMVHVPEKQLVYVFTSNPNVLIQYQLVEDANGRWRLELLDEIRIPLDTEVYEAAASSDGRLVGYTNKGNLFIVSSNMFFSKVEDHYPNVNAVVISSNGGRIAYGTDDGIIAWGPFSDRASSFTKEITKFGDSIIWLALDDDYSQTAPAFPKMVALTKQAVWLSTARMEEDIAVRTTKNTDRFVDFKPVFCTPLLALDNSEFAVGLDTGSVLKIDGNGLLHNLMVLTLEGAEERMDVKITSLARSQDKRFFLIGDAKGRVHAHDTAKGINHQSEVIYKGPADSKIILAVPVGW